MEDGMLSYTPAGMTAIGTSCVSPMTASETRIAAPKPLPPRAADIQGDEPEDQAIGGLPPAVTLNAEQWEWLRGILNEPPRDIPRLRELLAEPSARG